MTFFEYLSTIGTGLGTFVNVLPLNAPSNPMSLALWSTYGRPHSSVFRNLGLGIKQFGYSFLNS